MLNRVVGSHIYSTLVYIILCQVQRCSAFNFSFFFTAASHHSLQLNAGHCVRGMEKNEFKHFGFETSSDNVNHRFLMLHCEKCCTLLCFVNCKCVCICIKALSYQSHCHVGACRRKEAALVFHLQQQQPVQRHCQKSVRHLNCCCPYSACSVNKQVVNPAL